MHRSLRVGITVTAALVTAMLPGTALGAPAMTGGIEERLSVSSNGTQGNGWSEQTVLSADGRIAAFVSHATNLVAGDTNAKEDVFIRDRTAGTTERISLAHDGSQSPTGADEPSISRDGRFVAFHSTSPLTPGDANGKVDVFVKDLQTGALERITGPKGVASRPTISGDGRHVVFSSVEDTYSPQPDLYLHDRETGASERVTTPVGGGETGQGRFSEATVSGDGRYVAYATSVQGILPHPDNPANIFVYDSLTNTTQRANVSSSGAVQQGLQRLLPPGMSDDGRHVAWHTVASNLVPGDTNNASDVFVRDLQAGTTKRINTAHGGGQSMPPGDPYGCPTCDFDWGVSVSADGRYVTYRHDAEDLVPDDTNKRHDLFQYDQQTGTTKRLNLSATGQQTAKYDGPNFEQSQAITPDGRHFSFHSIDDLVPGDPNSNVMEAFVGSRPQ